MVTPLADVLDSTAINLSLKGSPMSEHEWITLMELAVRTGTPITTLRTAAIREKLKAEKRGRDWFSTEAYYEQWKNDSELHRRGRRSKS